MWWRRFFSRSFWPRSFWPGRYGAFEGVGFDVEICNLTIGEVSAARLSLVDVTPSLSIGDLGARLSIRSCDS